MATFDAIEIKQAAEHNLKGVDLRLPKGKLIVITGVSGSGKSSLAFDTIYAEGYRKYLDSLSPRVRGLLEQLPRPNVEYIRGLSPVIAVEQHRGSGSHPRSIVASVTEIYRYARLIWTHLGEAYCPVDGSRIVQRSMQACIERLFEEPEGSKFILLAPLFEAKPAVLREELPALMRRGYQRVRLNGQWHRLDDPDCIDSQAKSIKVELVVDRLLLKKEQKSRMIDSLELAFREADDQAVVAFQDDAKEVYKEYTLTRKYSSEKTGLLYDALTPQHLSYNHPKGACPTCGGLGETMQFHEDLLVPDPTKSVRGGAIKPLRLGSKQMIIRNNAWLKQLAEQLPFDPKMPWADLDDKCKQQIMHGAEDRLFSFRIGPSRKVDTMPFEGVLAHLKRTQETTTSDGLRARLMAYQYKQNCHACGGTRFGPRAKNVFVKGVSIAQFLSMTLADALEFVDDKLSGEQNVEGLEDALSGLRNQLYYLNEVGLGYIELMRPFQSLSGGEAQRVRLASQLGSGLSGVIYVLDEPSMGLHPVDHDRLMKVVMALRDRGNTVVVVEHDADTMRQADYLIELGPGAGVHGGHLLYQGSVEGCMKESASIVGDYLSARVCVEKNAEMQTSLGPWLRVLGARAHNLKHVDAAFPVGSISAVCGVSGSGKSTLIHDILGRAAAYKLNGAKDIAAAHDKVEGLEHFKTVVRIDQTPIGRSPRSNPASYIKLLDQLRQLFSRCPISKIRGYKPSRFSFNVKGGRCERCQGDGQIKLDMQFMADAYMECPSCGGKRYNRETLEVRFKGHTIADVLNMTVADAMRLFRNQTAIMSKLETLSAVGLDYLKLGQPAHTLSGGEAQRIKLSLELSRREQGRSLYLLDEPTSGLHWEDIQKLLDLLFKLRDAGNTLIIVEHHMDVIRHADWIIELGPGGGVMGGEVVYAGEGSAFRGADTVTARCL